MLLMLFFAAFVTLQAMNNNQPADSKPEWLQELKKASGEHAQLIKSLKDTIDALQKEVTTLKNDQTSKQNVANLETSVKNQLAQYAAMIQGMKTEIVAIRGEVVGFKNSVDQKLLGLETNVKGHSHIISPNNVYSSAHGWQQAGWCCGAATNIK